LITVTISARIDGRSALPSRRSGIPSTSGVPGQEMRADHNDLAEVNASARPALASCSERAAPRTVLHGATVPLRARNSDAARPAFTAAVVCSSIEDYLRDHRPGKAARTFDVQIATASAVCAAGASLGPAH
jgi:hypothetical protein